MSAGTAVLTSVSDDRAFEAAHKPVWKRRITATFVAADTAAAAVVVPVNGVITAIVVSNPANTNSVTATTTLTDDLSGVLKTTSAVAAGAVLVLAAPSADFAELPVSGNITVSVAISGAPGLNGLATIVELRGL